MSMLDNLINVCRRKSPWLFHLDAGSCNGCDLELIASLTPRYDAEQLGILMESSPRHCDILVISGPVTRTCSEAVQRVYAQTPNPKVVVAIGSCPASGNVFAGSPTIVGPLERVIPVDVYIPGCPPRPDAVFEGLAQAAAILGGDKPRPVRGRTTAEEAAAEEAAAEETVDAGDAAGDAGAEQAEANTDAAEQALPDDAAADAAAEPPAPEEVAS